MQASWSKDTIQLSTKCFQNIKAGSNNACQNVDSAIGSLKLQDIDMYIFRKSLKKTVPVEEKEFSKGKAKPISAWCRSVDKTGFAIVGLFLK